MANDYVLRPVLDKTFMEHELERAFKHVDSGQAIGKVVIKFRYVVNFLHINILITLLIIFFFFSNLNGPTVMMPRPSGILF